MCTVLRLGGGGGGGGGGICMHGEASDLIAQVHVCGKCRQNKLLGKTTCILGWGLLNEDCFHLSPLRLSFLPKFND